ncbi:MAG: alpha-glucuronidase [Mariniphaga sp.]|nr:alpha-glucuronidase [Mariniphaga sp.]
MMKTIKIYFVLLAIIIAAFSVNADDGYGLWLNYQKAPEPVLKNYHQQIKSMMVLKNSPTLKVAENELFKGLVGILGRQVSVVSEIEEGSVVAGNISALNSLLNEKIKSEIKDAGEEGYIISSVESEGKNIILITANSDVGVLYGVFNFLQLLQTGKDIGKLDIISSPKVKIRVLNHWDNLDRTVERGYAGFSLWDWHRLPGYLDPRYTDYARANASLGINGTVLNNVNANPAMLTPQFLEKAAALADIFRPYGLKVYLSVKFSSPVDIGGLNTADPLEIDVQEWWKKKIEEVYSYIPDFGGLLIKANSEGQPGPQNYDRTHAEGANMLADALAPFGGIVMWRAFVYDNNVPDDRAKQAQNEFKPLDVQFRDNVLVQVKNGPIDFQPREPFHPLFGAMPGTPLMMEFQITQEYLGQATNLVYLAPMYKECLDSDTYAKGEGSTVAKVVDGSLENHKLTGMAGVANTGNDRNWTGHLFGQSNWFTFGKLAWNHELTSEEIAEDWIKMTFYSDSEVVASIKKIMLESRETTVNYMTPLGLHHIMGRGHHYGPGPWVTGGRPDWTSLYYHKADKEGIGFDRTPSGSNATGQYFKPVADMFANLETCPEEYLLWFHHLPWDYKMKSGKTLWEEICIHYYDGVKSVRNMQVAWGALQDKIDSEKFKHVQMLLSVQEKEAVWWRNSCVLYFQTFSEMPIPNGFEKPDQTLEYYRKLTFRFAPGN